MGQPVLVVLGGLVALAQRSSVVSEIHSVCENYDGSSQVSFTWDLSLGGTLRIYVQSRDPRALVSASRQVTDTFPGLFSVCDSETE